MSLRFKRRWIEVECHAFPTPTARRRIDALADKFRIVSQNLSMVSHKVATLPTGPQGESGIPHSNVIENRSRRLDLRIRKKRRWPAQRVFSAILQGRRSRMESLTDSKRMVQSAHVH
jgi:hypothetical protein